MRAPITPDNMLPAMADHAARRGFPLGFRAAGLSPQGWRAAAQKRARDLIIPEITPVDFDPEISAGEDRGDHVAHHLWLTLSPGHRVPGLLLMPKGQGPFPAVLALHDHGSEFRIGKEKCITPPGGPDQVAEAWSARFFGGRPPGDALARRGYAVLCLDAPGWGERPGNGYEAQQALAANLMNLGLTAAGLMAWEDLRAADFLASLPEVDSTRIASVGFSMGAFRAWQVAALSPHIAAGVASCWMASLPGLMAAGNNHLRGQSAFWMTHPLLFRDLDLPDLAALAAPKPMWFQVGLQDHLFPARAVTDAFAKLSEVWQAWGAADRLSLSRPESGHIFTPDRQAEAFDWLDAALA